MGGDDELRSVLGLRPTSDPAEIPEAWRDAAEEIRAHLCALRGGAPFLSPADALQVFGWLEAGVPVPRVLLALERAAAARRVSRSRIPLSVVSAKRHLGRPSAGAFHRDTLPRGGEPPLAPVVRALELVPPSGYDEGHRAGVATALLGVTEPGEVGLRTAIAAVRTFFEGLWADAPPAVRAGWTAEAEAELGDLLALVDDGTRAALVEETARDRVRARYPTLTAATLAALLEPSP
ncbi:MAG: hypothetical protein ABMA64_25825 [Myxococcota bacterium]